MQVKNLLLLLVVFVSMTWGGNVYKLMNDKPLFATDILSLFSYPILVAMTLIEISKD